MNQCRFANPKEVAIYILVHMQNAEYDGKMSAFYSKYLVEALVQSSVEAKKGASTGRRSEGMEHVSPLTLDQFRELANAQEARMPGALGKKRIHRIERPS
jgi:hypothetical protein